MKNKICIHEWYQLTYSYSEMETKLVDQCQKCGLFRVTTKERDTQSQYITDKYEI